jgi:triosephosphate isomerase
MRTPLIAGNWKLNKTIAQAEAFVVELTPLVANVENVDVLICPVFTSLPILREQVAGSNLLLGAQNMFWKNSGAYTGEVSPELLKDAGCTHVIIGHSERRGRFGVPEADLEGEAGLIFGDNDYSVHKKVLAALENELTPIVCVGETLTERQNGHTDAVVSNQTAMALQNARIADGKKIVFAYEPVWAIGTGETCAAEEANRVCGVIRAAIAGVLGENLANEIRIQYGGSVKPDNAADLLGREHIDGALVGGASLKTDSFAAIVRAADAGAGHK